MTEVLFYHLQNMSIENVLPPLLEKSLERGWRVVVQSTSQERADALDAHLWTYQRRFVPAACHLARERCGGPADRCRSRRPIRTGQCPFLIDNAALPADTDRYERVVLVFNGDDGEALDAARQTWKDCKAKGFRGHLLAGRRTRPLAATGIGYWRD